MAERREEVEEEERSCVACKSLEAVAGMAGWPAAALAAAAFDCRGARRLLEDGRDARLPALLPRATMADGVEEVGGEGVRPLTL